MSSIVPVSRVGGVVGGILKTKARMSSGDQIVIHLHRPVAHMTADARLDANGEFSQIAEAFVGSVEATLVVSGFPFLSRTVAALAADSVGLDGIGAALSGPVAFQTERIAMSAF